jgi:hypothetical protein
MKKTFEDCLSFIENELGLQLLTCQKEMLQKLYENEYYYFLPGRAYGRETFLKAAELLEEIKKEKQL